MRCNLHTENMGTESKSVLRIWGHSQSQSNIVNVRSMVPQYVATPVVGGWYMVDLKMMVSVWCPRVCSPVTRHTVKPYPRLTKLYTSAQHASKYTAKTPLYLAFAQGAFIRGFTAYCDALAQDRITSPILLIR